MQQGITSQALTLLSASSSAIDDVQFTDKFQLGPKLPIHYTDKLTGMAECRIRNATIMESRVPSQSSTKKMTASHRKG